MAKLPATAVQLQSFSVDLSLPDNETYRKTLEGWSEFIDYSRNGDIRSALIRNRIESIACEALLHTIIYFDLSLTVSLILESSTTPSRAFCINTTTANWLLEKMRTTEPVLSSEQIPQAENLTEVQGVVRRLSKNADFSEGGSMDASERRHANYYRQAARILGLIDSSGMLAVPGRMLMAAGTESAQHIILKSQFEISECGWAWNQWAKKDRLEQVNPSSALKFLHACAPSLSEATAERRSRTLLAWHTALFPAPTLGF